MIAARAIAIGLLIAASPTRAQAQAQTQSPPQSQPQVQIQAQDPARPRPRVGVAFGGGSARGFAHVGVLRWFEEHRIPIDFIAGTSMGGLIGGAYSSGMNPAELEHLLSSTDWNEMFGATSYAYKNIRRKQDTRFYPSRLEFGLKGGLAMPTSLNNGQHVDFLIARIVAPYSSLASFDDLPTPFRCVAVDLRSATQVVLDRGSLAQALRATMSLPGIFPPVETEGKVLVDGGAMNNVPADVVRAMGADVVIAVNVGSMSETRTVSMSLLGLIGSTVDAMMLASTRRGIAVADLVINPPLEGFGSLDWRRAVELAQDGYNATNAHAEALRKFIVDEAEWQRHLAARAAKRRTTLPVPASLEVVGATKSDERRIRALLEPNIGHPLDLAALEEHLNAIGGMDRYLAVHWDLRARDERPELFIQTRQKPYGPPFLMLSTTLQNTTSTDFTFQLAGRYLRFDLLGVGSELRIDAAVGSTPNLAVELYRPIGLSPLFVALSAGLGQRRLNFISDGAIVAQYDQQRTFGIVDVGVNVSRISEVRLGLQGGRLNADRKVGDPGLPSLDGAESLTRLRWIYDSQNNVVAPSTGTRAIATIRYVFQSPDLPEDFPSTRSNDELGQFEIEGSRFWAIRTGRDRLFVTGGAGATFHGNPLATDQFSLGMPFRLSAFDIGEVRGDHYMALTGGYLRGIGRLPDFVGGPVFVGSWLENGAAYDDLADARLRTHFGVGAILETLLGPASIGASFGFDGQRRYFVGLGRIWP
jgi:NTE family protein